MKAKKDRSSDLPISTSGLITTSGVITPHWAESGQMKMIAGVLKPLANMTFIECRATAE